MLARPSAMLACTHGTRPTRKGNQMSNHFSADNLKFPGDDRRLDLTDVFMFTSADDPDKTVLIMDSNPTSAPPPIPPPTTRPASSPTPLPRITTSNTATTPPTPTFTSL